MTLSANKPLIPNNHELKLLLILVIIVLILFSFPQCTVNKNKQMRHTKMDSSISITSNGYRKIEKDSIAETSTKVTEIIDTTITIKGDTTSASKPIDNILRGDTLKSVVNGLYLKVFTDGKGLLKAIAIVQDRKVKINKIRNIETKSKVIDKGESTIKESNQTKMDVKKEDKNLNLNVKTSYLNWWWLLLIIPILGLGYWGYKK